MNNLSTGQFYPHKENCLCFRCTKIPWNINKHAGIKPWLGKKREDLTKENNNKWRGNDVNYGGLHQWVRRNSPKIKECVYCGEDEKRIEWASISHHAKRDLSDYIPLCISCHRQYDRKARKV